MVLLFYLWLRCVTSLPAELVQSSFLFSSELHQQSYFFVQSSQHFFICFFFICPHYLLHSLLAHFGTTTSNDDFFEMREFSLTKYFYFQMVLILQMFLKLSAYFLFCTKASCSRYNELLYVEAMRINPNCAMHVYVAADTSGKQTYNVRFVGALCK